MVCMVEFLSSSVLQNLKFFLWVVWEEKGKCPCFARKGWRIGELLRTNSPCAGVNQCVSRACVMCVWVWECRASGVGGVVASKCEGKLLFPTVVCMHTEQSVLLVFLYVSSPRRLPLLIAVGAAC